MKVSFEGIGDLFTTFYSDPAVTAGNLVKVIGNGKVGACADGDIFAGVAAHKAHDDFATVKISGFVKAAYAGTAPGVGYVKLAAAGAVSVKVSESGRELLVVTVDTTAKQIGFFM
jgi:hypothetical protein